MQTSDILLFLAIGAVLVLAMRDTSSESFVLSDQVTSDKSKLDPFKKYSVGTVVTQSTVDPALYGGSSCALFPATVYRNEATDCQFDETIPEDSDAVCSKDTDGVWRKNTVVTVSAQPSNGGKACPASRRVQCAPVAANCLTENQDSYYSFAATPIWGMAITRTFVRTSKPMADNPILIRHVQSGLYLMGAASTSGSNVVFGALSEAELGNPATNPRGQWTIKNTTLSSGVVRQQLVPAVNTALVAQPEACVGGNNIAVKIAATKDDACSGSYSNGIAQQFTGWWFQLAAGGLYIGHYQSNFRVQPYGGTAAQGVQAVLFDAAAPQALFEWRYV
jgi:hypothetical protein